mgnify:CR=1 FL=1
MRCICRSIQSSTSELSSFASRPRLAIGAPMMTVTHAPTRSAKKFCSPMMVKAPTTGPAKVPIPPSRLISTTSPEVCQSASVRVTKVKTMALVDPARPDSAAEITKATSL